MNVDMLVKVRDAEVAVSRLLRERDRLRELASGLTGRAPGDKVASPQQRDPMGDAVARLADLESELAGQVCELVALKRSVLARLDEMEDARLAEVLYRRYVAGETWDSVAQALGVTPQWAHRMHRRGLLKFAQVE